MELLQLKYFQTVARLEHMTKAAEELKISQPSLSIMISRLEEELEVELFTRKGRNIHLNDNGRLFLKHVNTVFRELDEGKQELKELLKYENRRVTVATTNTIFLSEILTGFLQKNNDTSLNQFFNEKNKIENSLRLGEIDFAISSPPIEGKGISCEILKEEKLVLIVPSVHRFAKLKTIDLSEAKDENFVALASGYSYRALTDQICIRAGFFPRIIFEVDDALIYDILQLNRGVALAPKSAVKRYPDNKNLKAVDIDFPDTSFKVGLSWLTDKKLNDSSKSFRDFVLNHYVKNL